MTHVMVDIESGGLSPNGALLTIGAVAFDPKEKTVGQAFYKTIDPTSAVINGGELHAKTVQWWMTQPGETRWEVWNSNISFGIETSLSLFNIFLDEVAPEELYIWANAPQFDLVIIRSAMERLKIQPKWKYYEEMDMRTIRVLAWGKDRKKEKWYGLADPNNDVKDYLSDSRFLKMKSSHNALVDAVRQAAMVNQCYEKLSIQP